MAFVPSTTITFRTTSWTHPTKVCRTTPKLTISKPHHRVIPLMMGWECDGKVCRFVPGAPEAHVDHDTETETEHGHEHGHSAASTSMGIGGGDKPSKSMSVHTLGISSGNGTLAGLGGIGKLMNGHEAGGKPAGKHH
mmetsp:Transcript_3104/g.5341  ORF Transcript_3104/g.5341 Transcript_3104/m.5341 type:complete len:137 (+) Transcript_3104:363-773(+)